MINISNDYKSTYKNNITNLLSCRKFIILHKLTTLFTKHNNSKTMTFNYDIIVVGAGHAGCEAAHAAAKMGAKTCLITMDMEKIAQMSCNPAIGGIAKGQIVREIDALGGLTGIVTDKTTIQFRMLNLSKGPAMWSPRAQCDRMKFSATWRKILENTENLTLWQDQAEELLVEEKHVKGIKTIWGVDIYAKCVIITAGTFLNGLMHIGNKQISGGRISEPASLNFSESIEKFGITKNRMKTGTPIRIDSRSVNFRYLTEQVGESDFRHFSFTTDKREIKQLSCWICNTNKECHNILRQGLNQSPLYNGQIKSIGPRYCPSIETKLHTFADKDQHPLFLEPEGLDTNEMYLNGFSSSLPIDIQINALKKIPAFEHVKVYRPGYAIEYDFFDPTLLNHTLESKIIDGLYFAGQVNGTTGYEEAAGQGLVAGINAAMKYKNLGSFVMGRDESYIGVLIDDLVTKGVDEPYRMFTSRAEYRILLRQDNADARLTSYGIKFGLIDKEREENFNNKQKHIKRIVDFCNSYTLKPSDINTYIENIGTTPINESCKLSTFISRPKVAIKYVAEYIPELKDIISSINYKKEETIETAEIKIKYNGYIAREKQEAEKMRRLESIKIKGHFKYEEIKQISTEGRQKLAKINPENLGQASRIPGVSPSDINVLLVLLHR